MGLLRAIHCQASILLRSETAPHPPIADARRSPSRRNAMWMPLAK